jgi:hypothetical protein
VNFRLTATDLDFWVDVRIRSFGDRWMAVAHIGGDPEIGLGATAREALAGSLGSLGDRAATVLLADPQLFGISRNIL